jgi:hypothetical protein
MGCIPSTQELRRRDAVLPVLGLAGASCRFGTKRAWRYTAKRSAAERKLYATQSWNPCRRFASGRNTKTTPWRPLDLHDDNDDSASPYDMDQPPSGPHIQTVMERIPYLCCGLALIRPTETRQEHLPAMHRLDCARRCRTRWGIRLPAMNPGGTRGHLTSGETPRKSARFPGLRPAVLTVDVRTG